MVASTDKYLQYVPIPISENCIVIVTVYSLLVSTQLFLAASAATRASNSVVLLVHQRSTPETKAKVLPCHGDVAAPKLQVTSQVWWDFSREVLTIFEEVNHFASHTMSYLCLLECQGISCSLECLGFPIWKPVSLQEFSLSRGPSVSINHRYGGCAA